MAKWTKIQIGSYEIEVDLDSFNPNQATLVMIGAAGDPALVNKRDLPVVFAAVEEYIKSHPTGTVTKTGGSSDTSLCQRCAIKVFGIDEQYAYPGIAALVALIIGYSLGKK